VNTEVGLLRRHTIVKPEFWPNDSIDWGIYLSRKKMGLIIASGRYERETAKGEKLKNMNDLDQHLAAGLLKGLIVVG
jgi:hypothetical protein